MWSHSSNASIHFTARVSETGSIKARIRVLCVGLESKLQLDGLINRIDIINYLNIKNLRVLQNEGLWSIHSSTSWNSRNSSIFSASPYNSIVNQEKKYPSNLYWGYYGLFLSWNARCSWNYDIVYLPEIREAWLFSACFSSDKFCFSLLWLRILHSRLRSLSLCIYLFNNSNIGRSGFRRRLDCHYFSSVSKLSKWKRKGSVS